jgi:hypothetical protein
MTFDEILSNLQADGWPLQRLGEGTARCSFRGEKRTFSFFVHHDGSYVSMAAVPYLRLPAHDAQCQKLMDHLLHLNREINFAKFSVDDDGDVVLSVEYPLADMDPSELRDALDVLTFYADKYWAELDALASANP